MAIIVLAVAIFFFHNLREKRSLPLTEHSKVLAAHWLKIADLEGRKHSD